MKGKPNDMLVTEEEVKRVMYYCRHSSLHHNHVLSNTLVSGIIVLHYLSTFYEAKLHRISHI